MRKSQIETVLCSKEEHNTKNEGFLGSQTTLRILSPFFRVKGDVAVAAARGPRNETNAPTKILLRLLRPVVHRLKGKARRALPVGDSPEQREDVVPVEEGWE